MTHFQKGKAIFNFPQKEVISKHFCKIEQKGGQKTTNMYLVFTLCITKPTSTSVGSIYAKLKKLNEFYPLLDQTHIRHFEFHRNSYSKKLEKLEIHAEKFEKHD